ncbi:hypothetical protein [Microbacterium foliorum]|uniref:hypothetical protein n=1 Tax=Microbacterium foliorum TaxID=104336 RepID=UPI001DA7F58C|nr:hypothetical protein [Microbacterium foliorum]CAH0238071.1 hypothetical protein SRABI03_02892 [Microbacterium foliorum]CAH0249919.1 hypothetical protein SRABI44_03130 [Microbacterium foliorum]
MKLLTWTTIVAIIVGAIFVLDGYASWPSGSLLEVDPARWRTAVLSLSIGSTLVGIGILAGLLALHARAVGLQTRAALAFHSAADAARAAEAARALHAQTERADYRG